MRGASGLGTEEGWLYSLQARCELDGVLYMHGSPLSDVESFPPSPVTTTSGMLDGVHDTTVVFGHSHLQFQRPGPNGTTSSTRAAPACRSTATSARRTRCGMTTVGSSSAASSTTSERVATAWAELGGPFGELASQRIRRGSD